MTNKDSYNGTKNNAVNGNQLSFHLKDSISK